MATQPVRGQVEWPGKAPPLDVTIDLDDTDYGSGSHEWRGQFPLPPLDLLSLRELLDLLSAKNGEAAKIRITLEDGRSGRAFAKIDGRLGGPWRVNFVGASELE